MAPFFKMDGWDLKRYNRQSGGVYTPIKSMLILISWYLHQP
jgi:hypothetical protein